MISRSALATTSPVLTATRSPISPTRPASASDSCAEGALHREPGAHRPQRVVLGDPRHAEDRLHPVAQELRDDPALGLDLGAHRVVVAVHEALRGLGVEALLKRRRSLQVREDDRDDLARGRVLARGRGERSAAGLAEAGSGLTRGAARRAARRERDAAAPAEAGARLTGSAAARTDQAEDPISVGALYVAAPEAAITPFGGGGGSRRRGVRSGRGSARRRGARSRRRRSRPQLRVASSIASAASSSRVSDCRRAARFVVLPIALQISRSAARMLPTKAGPVAIPTPTAISPPSPSTISRAASTAARSLRSSGRGAPNTAIIPSPLNSTIEPPCRCTSSDTRWVWALTVEKTSSAARRSAKLE